MDNISFAIPVSGALYDGSLSLLNKCGLDVSRPNGAVELNSLVPIQKSPETDNPSADKSYVFQPSTNHQL